MERKIGKVVIMIAVLLMSMALTAVPTVKASGTIYIRADGSIDPPTAPIATTDNITYTFTDDIYDEIVVNRSNIVVDGNRYNLQGSGSGNGFYLTGMSNVTIKNANIESFGNGICLVFSTDNAISGNNITANTCGIALGWGASNVISGNNITNNGNSVSHGYGIYISLSSDNMLSMNNIVGNYEAIWCWRDENTSIIRNNIALNDLGIILDGSLNATVSGNNIEANHRYGIEFFSAANYNVLSGNNIKTNGFSGIFINTWCQNNSIVGNNIEDNQDGLFTDIAIFQNTICENNFTSNWRYGILLLGASGNKFYHNNIIDNNHQVYCENTLNDWDDGYPSGGNYWSDYTGVDFYSGTFQNETGSDGFGDTHYIINEDNRDRYPLIAPWPLEHDIAITSTTASKTVVGQGYSLNINVTAANQGDYTETFNVTACVNTTAIETTEITLTGRNSTAMTFTWNTTGFALGNYTISAVADVVTDETDTLDNTYTDGIVTVRLPIHDIAVTDVRPSKTVVCQDYNCCDIDATVVNQGDSTETFDVTVYANDTATGNTTSIATFMNVTLAAGTSTNLIFDWNTSGFVKGNYTIKAIADTVPGETETSDNSLTDGWVIVAMIGDITGSTVNPWDFVPDGKVDGKDLAVVARCFGSWPGAPPPMIWNPNCDINEDGKIDGKDRAIGAKHFGESDP